MAKKSRSVYTRSFIFPKYCCKGTCIPLDTIDSIYKYFHYKKYDVEDKTIYYIGYRFPQVKIDQAKIDYEEKVKACGDEGEWRIKFKRVPDHQNCFWYYDSEEQADA